MPKFRNHFLLTITPTLVIEAEFNAETYVNNYVTTHCRISEDRTFRDLRSIGL